MIAFCWHDCIAWPMHAELIAVVAFVVAFVYSEIRKARDDH